MERTSEPGAGDLRRAIRWNVVSALFAPDNFPDRRARGGGRLPGVHDSCFGFPQHGFSAHRDRCGQRRGAHRSDAGNGHAAD